MRRAIVRSIALLSTAVLAAQAPTPAKPSDAELAHRIRQALASETPQAMQEALKALRAHPFTNLRSPERELALYAEGVFLTRLGQRSQGALALRKLERLFPQSPYLGEAHLILAQEAVERRRFTEAETRLRRALQADIPIESKRQAQELLLWVFVATNRPAQGLPVAEALHPIGNGKPSERGLAALTEVLAHANRRTEAEAALTDLKSLYPTSSLVPRAELALGRMLGQAGDALAAAQRFQSVIRTQPSSPEADEARLALATLLSEQKLPTAQAQSFPTPESLLADIRRLENTGDFGQRSQLIQLRLHLQHGRWKEALDLIDHMRSKTKDAPTTLETYRGQALRAYAQTLLDGNQLEPLLPYLDREGVLSLTFEQRRLVAEKLTRSGLPEGAAVLLRCAPPSERPALRQTVLAATVPEVHPETVLDLVPATQRHPSEQLLLAEAALARKDHALAKRALAVASPGPRRITALLIYLRRPRGPKETAAMRLQEAEHWLRTARESASDREPLTILVADLRMELGDWKGALERYPQAPAPEHRGWVSLMRATALQRLGRYREALETLEAAKDAEAFRKERASLAQSLRPRP